MKALLQRLRRKRAISAAEPNAVAELTAVLEAVPMAVCIGSSGGIHRCNEAALRLFGVSSPRDLEIGTREFASRYRVRSRRDGGLLEPGSLPFHRALSGEVAATYAWITKTDTGEDIHLRVTAAPVLVSGKPVGAVVVYSDATTPEALQAAREAEASRIARDLHDELGQILAGLSLELKAFESRLAREGPADAWIEDWLVAAQSDADEAMASVRSIATRLRPKALEALGLGPALAEAAERFRARTGIPVEVAISAVPALGEAATTALYRIAEESLTNVARHAGASHVALRLGPEGEAVVLRVEDDGQGPEGDPGARPGLGVLGMRERASELGGSLRLERASPHGVAVVASLPLRKAAGESARPREP